MVLFFVVNEFVYIYRYFSFKFKNFIILIEFGKLRFFDFFNIIMIFLNVIWELFLNFNGIIKFYGFIYRLFVGKYSYILM